MFHSLQYQPARLMNFCRDIPYVRGVSQHSKLTHNRQTAVPADIISPPCHCEEWAGKRAGHDEATSSPMHYRLSAIPQVRDFALLEMTWFIVFRYPDRPAAIQFAVARHGARGARGASWRSVAQE